LPDLIVHLHPDVKELAGAVDEVLVRDVLPQAAFGVLLKVTEGAGCEDA
jgi:hypothetical protein